MILLAVGTQFAFDRLVRLVDEWAQRAGRTDIIAQVGPSRYNAKALKTFDFLDAVAFSRLQREAKFHIAHAGMGSILGALELGKPILILPRDPALAEHRNGHQLATARHVAAWPGVHVAWEEAQLRAKLDQIERLTANIAAAPFAPDEFVAKLRAAIETPHAGRVAPSRSALSRLLGSFARQGDGPR